MWKKHPREYHQAPSSLWINVDFLWTPSPLSDLLRWFKNVPQLLLVHFKWLIFGTKLNLASLQHRNNFYQITCMSRIFFKPIFFLNKIIIICRNFLKPNLIIPQFQEINIMCLKMCSLRGGDFRNRFSVFGLYVMPTHG